MWRSLLTCSLVLSSSSVLWLASTGAAQPRQWSARSNTETKTLVELYTSEGCSSCPPADAWLRDLGRRGLTAKGVVPLAFHVDYWDKLGWPDRFAQAIFTERQRTIAWRHGTRTIYTPQVVVQGKDWRDWRAVEARAAEIHDTPARATINVEVTRTAATQIEVVAQAEVAETAERPQAQMFVAVYENNLHSKVTAGENQGKTLHHDFVIRHWSGPVDVDDQGMARLQHTLALSSAWKIAHLGLVLFVQNHQNGAVLQVLELALGDQ